MRKTENIGLLYTAALLLLLFFWGYYGNKEDEFSMNTNDIQEQKNLINKDCSNSFKNFNLCG